MILLMPMLRTLQASSARTTGLSVIFTIALASILFDLVRITQQLTGATVDAASITPGPATSVIACALFVFGSGVRAMMRLSVPYWFQKIQESIDLTSGERSSAGIQNEKDDQEETEVTLEDDGRNGKKVKTEAQIRRARDRQRRKRQNKRRERREQREAPEGSPDEGPSTQGEELINY